MVENNFLVARSQAPAFNVIHRSVEKARHFGMDAEVQAMDGNQFVVQTLDSGNMPTRSFMFSVADQGRNSGTPRIAPNAKFNHAAQYASLLRPCAALTAPIPGNSFTAVLITASQPAQCMPLTGNEMVR